MRLPAAVVAQGSGVGCSEAVASTATATPTTTATTATPAATTTAATAVADHLGKTGVNLLLSLTEDSDEVTSLLSICRERSLVRYHMRTNDWGRGNILSVVKKVMAVPLAPARPVRPIRWT